MSISRKFIIFALSLVLFTVMDARAERVVLEYPPGHYLGCCTREVDGVGPWHYSPHIPAAACTNHFDFWDSAWYLNAGSFGGYEELAEKTLPVVSQVELRRQSAQVDTAFQGGAGALFRLTDHVALDVGLFGGSGNVTQNALDQRGTVAISSTADLRYIGGGLGARFFPAGTSSRLQPWLSVGARGIVLIPQSGSQTIEGRRFSVDERELRSIGATDLASGLGLNVRLNPRFDLAVSSDYGFRTGWRASLGIVLPVAPRRPRPAAPNVEFENPFDSAGTLHNLGLDHVLGDIQKAAASEPRKHTPDELLALVESSLRSYLREENLTWAGGDPVAEAKMRGERLTLDSFPPSVSVPQRDYVRQAVRLLEEAPEAGELRPSFDRLAAQALSELGPIDSPKLLASLSIAGNSAEYWRRNRLAWSEAVREYLGVPLPEPPEPAGLRWFKWGQVGAVDLFGALTGGLSTGNIGGVVIGGVVSSAFDAVGQLLNHWIFGRAALAPTPLGCILRGGRFCDQSGFGCLVMFPEAQWRSMRNVYPGAFELDGQAQVRLGERPSLYYVFSSAPAQELKSLPIKMDVSLDRSVAASLGFKNVVILQGTYEVDQSIGRFGGVVFDVKVDNVASDDPQIANPANPQDDFGRFHNDGILYFRSQVKEKARVLTDANFAAEFETVMTPWARKVSRDPSFLRIMGTSDPEVSFRRLEAVLGRIKDEPALQERLKLVPDTVADQSDANSTPEWKVATRTYRDIVLQASLLDGKCISYEQYQRQVRLVESQVLRDSESRGGVLALQLAALARYSAALADEHFDTRASFPWKDVLGGDFHGALDGAAIGALAPPGGAPAGAIIGGLFGSAWALYEHGYVRD